MKHISNHFPRDHLVPTVPLGYLSFFPALEVPGPDPRRFSSPREILGGVGGVEGAEGNPVLLSALSAVSSVPSLQL